MHYENEVIMQIENIQSSSSTFEFQIRFIEQQGLFKDLHILCDLIIEYCFLNIFYLAQHILINIAQNISGFFPSSEKCFY